MLKLIRSLWADRKALEILNLSWSISREYVFRTPKEKVDEAIDNIDEVAAKVTDSYLKIRDKLIEGDADDLPEDEETLKEMKKVLGKKISEIDKALSKD